MSDNETRAVERAINAGDVGEAARLVATANRSGGIDAAIEAWLALLAGRTNAHNAAVYSKLKPEVFKVEKGKKFARVWKGSSCYCFIDLATGTILKPGGWKAPEPRKIPRGNILAADPLAGCGPHGVSYVGAGHSNAEWHTSALAAGLAAPAPVAPPVAFVPQAVAPGATVRTREAFGPCTVLGELIAETETHYSYRSTHDKYGNEDNRTKLAKKKARATHSGFPSPAPHVVPCVCCADHPESNFGPGRCSVHGRATPCTTCMET